MSGGDFTAVWIPAAGVAVALAVVRVWLPFAVAGVAVIAFVATAGYALNHWEDYSDSHIARVFDWIDAALGALAVCCVVVGVVGLIARHVRKRPRGGVVA